MNLRRIALPLLAALLLAPLSACTSLSPGGSAADSSNSHAKPGSDLSSSGAEDSSIEQPSGSAVGAERSIVQEGSLELIVDSPRTTAEEVAEIAKNLGGYVESQNLDSSSSGGGMQAFLQLRVPNERLDDAFTELAKLGDVSSQSRSSTDVTVQHVDLQARVKALDASVERLTKLMSGAASTSELIEAESALAERQQELDGLRAQLKSLEGLVNESSIAVSISSKSTLPGGGPANFWEGLVAGWNSIVASGAGALVLLGVLLPWLAFGGAVTLIIMFIVRASRRTKRRKSAVSDTPKTAETLETAEKHAVTPQQ